MPASDIFQAMRNVWTMSCLQLLLGLPIRLTPAIFAYSMLYPYTDNYLDDASVPEADKVSFNERFARRLAGERVIPANLLESRVYDMVGMIEGQFDRASHAGVYGSLLAIHQAQCSSVSLMRLDASPYELDVLGISLHKGGASVLADGYLVAGDLDPTQAAFLFGWGAVVQFGDDLQDVVLDGQHGPITVFSQTAGRWPLDGVTDRTFHFGRKVMAGLDCFDGPNAGPVKDLMRRSASRLLIEAAGMADHLYTPDYVRELEPHSTLSFGFLRQRAKMMAGQTDSIMRLVEAFARLDPDEDPPPFPLPA
jgi:hypothetical protein